MSFWQAKAKIRPADKLFSEYVRKRDGDCVFKIKCNGGKDFKELTCSHFHGRRKEPVRFDPDNGDAACRACHMYLEEHKGEYYRRKFQMLGEKKFNLLTIRANTPQKKDDAMQILILKELLK